MSDAPPEKDPDADLRPSDRLVLRVVRESGGEISQRDLCAEAGLPPATASTAVSRLTERDLVETRVTPADARCRVISSLE